ncbi:MAG: uroporphyrinogen decarboxylase/cobalamine-independent methonine synthase family protein [Saccharofermentanales bacterium]
MNNDKKILRELASQYFEYINSDKNRSNILLHKKVNDLQPSRPIVLIDEIPWHEMNLDNELDLHCTEEQNRNIEFFFRTQIFRWIHMPADMVLEPYFPVYKAITSTGTGLGRITKEHDANALSYVFVDQLQNDADLEKLHNEVITYDRGRTMQDFSRIAELFGDILPVRITGEATGYGLGCKTMDDIVILRGLEHFFYDFIDRPAFMHRMIGRLTDIFLDRVRQYNELELFDTDAYYCHSTSALTNDLHPDHNHPNSKNVWGRGLAQIFASVGPDMQDEFDTQYMIRAMEPFGLIYYGCCEPLDTKIHLLEQIRNLRKISITPWADIDRAAEIIRNRYVIASKPNPAFLAAKNLNEDAISKELSRIVSACRRNGCTADIVLKDITTVCNSPENLFRWEKIAMEIVSS